MKQISEIIQANRGDFKICPACQLPKPHNEDYFYVNNHNISGLDNCCKDCKKKRNEKYKQTPEKHREYVRAWYNKNKEQVKKNRILKQLENEKHLR